MRGMTAIRSALFSQQSPAKAGATGAHLASYPAGRFTFLTGIPDVRKVAVECPRATPAVHDLIATLIDTLLRADQSTANGTDCQRLRFLGALHGTPFVENGAGLG